MKKYKYILFDLDGTITDSYKAITTSFAYGLKCMGIDDYSGVDLGQVIGPPLRVSYMNLFGFDEEKALMAVEKYRERYEKKFLEEHLVYDGVPKLLENLYNDGFKLILATSKPADMAEKLMIHFDLKKYFCFLGGASRDISRDSKEKVLDYIYEQINADKDQSIMIGDRKYDMLGAEYLGIDAIGVLYGFGKKEELQEYNPVFLAEKPMDIYDFLTK